jgi:uncharacterized lipoprotein
MKKLLAAMAAIALFAGCHSTSNMGRPGEDVYQDTGYGYELNDRSAENKVSDNLRSYNTPARPHW